MAAGVDDERLRRQRRLDLVEPQRPRLRRARRAAPRGRRGPATRFDFGEQRRDAGLARGAFGPLERRARRLDPQAPHGEAGDDKLVAGARGGRQGRGIEIRQQPLDRVETADQQQIAALEIARMRGVGAVAAPLERLMRRVERLHRRGEVARDQRDLGLGDGAAGARDGLARAEAARRALQQRLGAVEIAELRHRDAAQRQRRRIVAQGDIVQRASASPEARRAPRR